MEIYLVGGAVRDRLLDLPVTERDWVVVGATPERMTRLGYRQVGKDFPVFIHPDSGEEYALARTERKTAPGYKGFEVHADPEVTLEDDLRRRDLTINAIAETPDGRLIDPFGGERDLRLGLLRHVSPAFAEDPVRILRVARFAARFDRWGFRVAHSTNALMRGMVDSGEVGHLVPERVWAELQRALSTQRPWRFFEVLRGCGALAVVFPEIDRLFGVPQTEKHHPEKDAGVHTLLVLRQACALSEDPKVRFAAVTHDLGKGVTPQEEWPSHRGHEERGEQLLRDLCRRLRCPAEYRDLALLTAREHGRVHRARELRVGTLLELLESCDALRRPQRFEAMLLACKADARGRPGHENEPYPQAELLRGVLAAVQAVDHRPLVERGLKGRDFAEALRDLRLRAVKAALDKLGDRPSGNPPQPQGAVA